MSKIKHIKGKSKKEKEPKLKVEKNDKVHQDEMNGKDPSTHVKELSSRDQGDQKIREDLGKVQKKFLYLSAEFDNYRKNMMKERSQLVKYGSKPLMMSLLSILDTFEQALQVEMKSDSVENFKDGMKMVCANLKKTLEDFGVREISFEKGAKFDPKLHEALDQEDSSEVEPGCIIKLYRKAYKLHDVIIRPAQVTVANEFKKLNHLKVASEIKEGEEKKTKE